MANRVPRNNLAGWVALFWGMSAAGGTRAQEQHLAASQWGQPAIPYASPQDGMSFVTLKELVRMSRQDLDQLYLQARAVPIPPGRARGRAIVFPGTALARPASLGARLVWQGKIFHCAEATAINKFFGVRMIKANVSCGESWMDGRPSIILDYSQTSLVYARYRDEIRQVAPGLFLGLMYSRTSPQPTFKMYFALET